MELAASCLIHFIFCVQVMEDELAALAELRMKEESATELSVGLFDTKRNIRVQKGRETQERERREREKSEVESSLWPVGNVQDISLGGFRTGFLGTFSREARRVGDDDQEGGSSGERGVVEYNKGEYLYLSR